MVLRQTSGWAIDEGRGGGGRNVVCQVQRARRAARDLDSKAEVNDTTGVPCA